MSHTCAQTSRLAPVEPQLEQAHTVSGTSRCTTLANGLARTRCAGPATTRCEGPARSYSIVYEPPQFPSDRLRRERRVPSRERGRFARQARVRHVLAARVP